MILELVFISSTDYTILRAGLQQMFTFMCSTVKLSIFQVEVLSGWLIWDEEEHFIEGRIRQLINSINANCSVYTFDSIFILQKRMDIGGHTLIT